MTADPDKACEHNEFATFANIARLTQSDDDPTVVAYKASISINCSECGEPFRFIGLPGGSLPDMPTTSLSHEEARLPIKPRSASHDFGLGLPGLSVSRVLTEHEIQAVVHDITCPEGDECRDREVHLRTGGGSAMNALALKLMARLGIAVKTDG